MTTAILFGAVAVLIVSNIVAVKALFRSHLNFLQSNKNFQKSADNFNELARVNEKLIKINDDLIERDRRFRKTVS